MDQIRNKFPNNADDAARFRVMLAATGTSPALITRFRKIILSYYRKNGRDLAWRHTTDPYHILVSEIMLQQTQVDRVTRKYPEFLAAFPTCTALADAPLGAVLEVWQGMGYNRRAIALRACARKMVDEYDGRLPADVEILATFPGIGRATASSIAAFAFNMPVVFIETNIRRVFIHFFFEGKEKVTDTEILPLAARALYEKEPGTWYNALMDYGSMLKTAEANPNRQSAHYTKQPKFAGSDREIRGQVLKALILNPDLEEEDLVRQIICEPERVYRIITDLGSEGFLIRDGGRVHLTGR